MTPLVERNQESSLEDIETIDIDLPSLSEVAVDAQVAFSLIPLPLSCPTMYGTIKAVMTAVMTVGVRHVIRHITSHRHNVI